MNRFSKALQLYEDEQFFEAHELWEELWHETSNNEDRDFLKALIQLCAAHIKREAEMWPAFERLLLRVEFLVSRYTNQMESLDAEWILKEVNRLRSMEYPDASS